MWLDWLDYDILCNAFQWSALPSSLSTESGRFFWHPKSPQNILNSSFWHTFCHGQQVSNRQWRGVDWNVVLTGFTSDCCIVIRRWTVILHWTKWVSSSTPTAVLPKISSFDLPWYFDIFCICTFCKCFFSFKILLMRDSIYIFPIIAANPTTSFPPILVPEVPGKFPEISGNCKLVKYGGFQK